MQNQAHVDGSGNIVIQGIDGATIIINPDNSDEIRKLIVDFGTKLGELPKDVLEIMEKKQDINAEIKPGANLYLSVVAEIHEYKEYRKLAFSLTITNLTKENRYFNQPFFKVNPKFTIFGTKQDTFVMIPNPNTFPKKLEYGEPLSVSYEIKDGAYKNYNEILVEDSEAYIQAFSNTTVGELYESNKFLISKLIKNLEWLKSDG